MITGIEIRPNFNIFPNIFPNLIRYHTLLVIQPQNKCNFISLKERISKRDLKIFNEEEMGRISFEVESYDLGKGHDLRVKLKEDEYWPFNAGPPKYFCLLGKGIADKIDLWITGHLMSLINEESQINFDRETDSGKFQLRRRGMHLSREYNLRKYHEILKEIIYNKSL
jgi:hypothetical protein